MKVGLMQRVLAGYRTPFFDLLSESFDGGLSIFAGEGRAEEMIDASCKPQRALSYPAKNLHLFKGGAYCCAQRNWKDWLTEWNPDALILEANQRYLTLPAAARWMRRRGRPVIGWGLGTGRTSAWLTKLFLRQFDCMIAYSSVGAAAYAAGGMARENIFIAKNAATRRPATPPPTRNAAGFDGQPAVLFVGRLQERKRVDLLIRACAALPQAMQPQLTIVGEGAIRPDLEALAVSNYPNTVFTGALYGAELEARFHQADLFVLPGTGGLALQQAMSAALPIIAAEADGTQADLARPGNSRLVQPGNLAELTRAMTEMLSDAPALRRMGTESWRIVREEINLEAMAESFRLAIDRALFLKGGA